MNAGALTPVDIGVLEQVLDELRPLGLIKFLEIGIYEGCTARGVKEYCDQHKVRLDYWGVDNAAICDPKPPFEGANLVIGDSTQVFYQVPLDFDAVLVDGNHSGNHVILDTIHYGQRVRRGVMGRSGGFFLFHDTSPEVTQTMREPGPDIPWFYNSVNEAHKLMGFPNRDWMLWKEKYQLGAKIGGMTVYRKL